jgi:hydroxyacylglutathione hydrolase
MTTPTIAAVMPVTFAPSWRERRCYHARTNQQEFYPMFQRYYDAGLAQASYLVACARTRQAVVIDPRRDVDIYLAAARQQQLNIVAAIETHVHADFVSGARELAALDVRIIAGPGSSLAYPAREARHDERLAFGDLVLHFLHTPGHTPEHISILATHPGEPARVFTGDTLFVAAVGRPDLLGALRTRELADDLYESIFHVLLALDDTVEMHPGHGAGSLCGTAIGSAASSTIGHERHTNPMLRFRTRDEFVAAVLADLPETPPYFARMKRVNQQGPPILHLGEKRVPPPQLNASATAEAVRGGAILIDVRAAETFCAEHPVGAINIGFGATVGYWAAWIVPADTPVVIFGASEREAAEIARQLMRVGLDSIAGFVDGGMGAWRAAGLPVASIPQIGAAELHDRLAHGERVTIVDVRTPHEWRSGHIEASVHVPVGEIPSRALDLPRDTLLATICEGGHRSSLAASLLANANVAAVANVTGGMAAFRAAERQRHTA